MLDSLPFKLPLISTFDILCEYYYFTLNFLILIASRHIEDSSTLLERNINPFYSVLD